MLSAYLNDPGAWSAFMQHRVLRESMAWLTQHAQDSALGDYPLGDDGWLANVHEYETGPEDGCVWESHERFLDIQYMISGQEGIRWAPASSLGEPLRRLPARDRLEWQGPARQATFITLRAGMFAVFWPGEAHCPMIALEESLLIRKAVVKIPISLLVAEQQ